MPPKKNLLSDARFTAVANELQSLINKEFIDGKYKTTFKFIPGDGVLCLSGGMYYEGEIRRYANMTSPETLYPSVNGNKECDFDRMVPSYIVLYPRRRKNRQLVDEEMAENEIIRRRPDALENVFGMLFAHEWNARKCEMDKLPEKRLVSGAWLIDKDTYAALDDVWIQMSNQPKCFADYCGRDFQLTMIK